MTKWKISVIFFDDTASQAGVEAARKRLNSWIPAEVYPGLDPGLE